MSALTAKPGKVGIGSRLRRTWNCARSGRDSNIALGLGALVRALLDRLQCIRVWTTSARHQASSKKSFQKNRGLISGVGARWTSSNRWERQTPLPLAPSLVNRTRSPFDQVQMPSLNANGTSVTCRWPSDREAVRFGHLG
jgi:hypothetical protein